MNNEYLPSPDEERNHNGHHNGNGNGKIFSLQRVMDPDTRGVVAISDTVNANKFGVSNRTIYTWKKTVEGCGYFWITDQYRPNMWPLTTYHLTCLHPPPRGRTTDNGGTYGSDPGRPKPQNPGLGARKPGQKLLP